MVSSVEDVGRRVVIRYRLRDESARWVYTDVLGVLESWMVTEDGEVLTVRQRDGSTVSIPAVDVVAGKPIPASTRGKPPATGPGLARVAALGLPAVTVEALGDWLLQASEGFTRRANAVVTCGSPGVPTDQAVGRVLAFYAEHDLPPMIQAVSGTPIEDELIALGWVSLTEQPVATQVARIGDLVKRLSSEESESGSPDQADQSRLRPELDVPLDDSWLRLYGRGSASSNAVRRVLTGPVSDGAGGTGAVTLARTTDPDADPDAEPDAEPTGEPIGEPGAEPTGEDLGRTVAIARASVTGPWLGISALTVAESHRRLGLARATLRALVDWGVEHQAGWAYLQVGTDNLDALRLYESLGFATDHTYRYYVPPAAAPRFA